MAVDIKVLRGKISKISGLTQEERSFLDQAVLSKYLDYSVKVSAILTLVKLTFSEDNLIQFKTLLNKARRAIEEGKSPWSQKDIQQLTDMFGFLKRDSRSKIIYTLTHSDKLFVDMLYDSLMSLDLKEVDKLTGLV